MHRWHCILSLCTAATLLSNNIIATNGYSVFFLLVVVVIFFPFVIWLYYLARKEEYQCKKNSKRPNGSNNKKKLTCNDISVERCGTVYIHLIEMIPGIHYSVQYSFKLKLHTKQIHTPNTCEQFDMLVWGVCVRFP